MLIIYGKSKLHKICALFNFVVGFWGIGAYFIGQITDRVLAFYVLRYIYLGVIFIPILNYHVVYLLCQLKEKIILRLIYLQGFVFTLFALFSSTFISDVRFVFNSFYFNVAGISFYFFFIIWFLIVIYSHFQLLKNFLHSKGRLRTQILYFFVGTALGFSGGITNFLPAFGIDIYPFGNFMIPIYCIIVTYAILKYRLLDVTVAVTRTGIFIAVYSIVLGLPIVSAYLFKNFLMLFLGENWWIGPLITSTLLGVAGPYIYSYIQKRAENRLLEEQRQYQATLSQASLGMRMIKDLKKLLNLIVYIISRAVHLEQSEIYLFDSDQKKFTLRTNSGKQGCEIKKEYLDDRIIKYFFRSNDPIVYEEIKQRVQDYEDIEIFHLEKILKELNAALVVPSFIESRLIAVIVLGKKRSGKLFSQDDLMVFSILANQAALAIENAMFYEDMKKTQAQLFKAEKMATLGTMADGLSHQINNRLHALGFIAGDALDTIQLKKSQTLTDDMKEFISDLEHALSRIQDNVKRGGEIVQGLLKYTHQGEGGFTAIDLNQLINASLEMAQFKIRVNEMSIIRDFTPEIPKIRGNFTQLQDVFFNVIDNAYDAMMERKEDLHEAGYQATLRISAQSNNNGHLDICVEDNGMGIKEEDKGKLFTPFFTTKLSSRKGTGLGLYVIQKLIEENHGGKVLFESTYRQGSRVMIRLPICF